MISRPLSEVQFIMHKTDDLAEAASTFWTKQVSPRANHLGCELTQVISLVAAAILTCYVGFQLVLKPFIWAGHKIRPENETLNKLNTHFGTYTFTMDGNEQKVSLLKMMVITAAIGLSVLAIPTVGLVSPKTNRQLHDWLHQKLFSVEPAVTTTPSTQITNTNDEDHLDWISDHPFDDTGVAVHSTAATPSRGDTESDEYGAILLDTADTIVPVAASLDGDDENTLRARPLTPPLPTFGETSFSDANYGSSTAASTKPAHLQTANLPSTPDV